MGFIRRGAVVRAFAMRHAVAIVASGFFTWAVVAGGIPSLRQDWFWGDNAQIFRDLIAYATSGWLPDGVGIANTYPTSYIATPIWASLGLILGGYGALVVTWYACGLALFCGFGALARAGGASRSQWRLLAVLGLFSPFCYTRIVAGHLNMLVALAGLAFIVAEALRKDRRAFVLVLSLAATIGQVQYFLLAFVIVFTLAVRDRRWTTLLAALLIPSPIAIGMGFDPRAVTGLPLNLVWEQSQSLAPLDALLLRGYFAGYAVSFNAALPTLGEFGFAAFALAGALLVFATRKPPTARAAGAVAAVAAVAVLLSMGLRGPLAAAVAYLFDHVAAFGVYRELSDFSGIALGAYVLLAGIACTRWPKLTAVLPIVIIMILTAWIARPPSTYFVDLRSLPTITPNSPPYSRYALYPAYQPLTFGGRGSGLDPDVYQRPRGVDAVNTYLPAYPSSFALAEFSEHGSRAGLEDLSVSCAIGRPYFSTDATTREQDGLRESTNIALLGAASQDCAFRPRPELTIGRIPNIDPTLPPLGSDLVFAGDARNVRGPGVPRSWAHIKRVKGFVASRAYLDAKSQWVDARYVFSARPGLGESIGGIATESRRPLPLPQNVAILAYVRGKLMSRGHLVVPDTHGAYRWTQRLSLSAPVVCHGLCILAAQSEAPPAVMPPGSRRNRRHRDKPVKFATPFSWVAIARVSPGPREFLRYNVAFDRGWIALREGKALPHVRVEAVFNGWIINARSHDSTVLIIEVVSAMQALAELAVFAFLLFFFAAELRNRSKAELKPDSWPRA